MKKQFLSVMAVLAMVFGMASCSSDSDDIIGGDTRAVNMVYPAKSVSLTQEQRSFVTANNTFAFNLFRAISKDDGKKSSFCSPLSVTYLLGMLNAGAEGNTQKEIQDVLGFGTDDPAAINEYCRNLMQSAPEVDPKVTLNIANSIFVNNYIGRIRADYQKEMEHYYDAEVADMDFTNVRNVDVINSWCDKKTNGMIPTVLSDDEFKPEVVMFLLNAIYFKADWTEKFEEQYTKKASFAAPSGKKEVNMMHQKVYVLYGETDDYSVISLPYGEGAFSMMLLLPKQGRSVDEVVNGLQPGVLTESALSTYEVDVKIPRWETNSDMPLIDILRGMGIRQVFDSNFAELTKMAESSILYVSMMKQLAKIEVNEAGSKAAAVTIAGVSMTTAISEPEPVEPPKAEFHADRPFVYLITERGSNAVFFIGKYTGE